MKGMSEKEMKNMPDRYSSSDAQLEKEKAAHSNLSRSDSMKSYHQGMREQINHNSGMHKDTDRKGGY